MKNNRSSSEHNQSSPEVEVTEQTLDFDFESDAQAEAVREAGLRAYNASKYGEALDHLYRVVRYFSKKYGATAPICGKHFLDYGLSQLRVLQAQKSVEDALNPRDEEALETCFINLEVARVCLQKSEDNLSPEASFAKEMLLAEVHSALAQLASEKDEIETALKEYETELLIYRTLQAEDADVPAGRVIAVLYSIAECFLKECDFDGADERLQATLDEVSKYPVGTISADLLEELRDRLQDAREMKDGKFKEIQASIQEQLAVVDCEHMPTAQEFYEGPGVADKKNSRNPYVTSIPGGVEGLREGSFLSMPTSATGQMLGLTSGGEHSNHSHSQSVSLFPPQGSRSGAPSNSGPVQHLVARKKAKKASSISISFPTAQPDAKKLRTE